MPKPNGWSNKQKRLAMMVCRSRGIDDGSRYLILRHLGRCALVNGEPTMTSPNLGNGDFEKFMALIEFDAPGEQLMDFEPGYWQGKWDNGTYGRLLYRAMELQHTLMDAGHPPGGAVAQAIGREYDTLYHLDQHELNKAIDAMTAIIHRKGAA